MPKTPRGALPSASIEFGLQQEVERYDPRSPARIKAQDARKEIEAGRAELIWHRCKAIGPAGTRLPGCRKLYEPDQV